MKTLHFVRHGESEWHKENRYAGHTDIKLTAEGRAQAELLVPWASDVQPSSIYSSDLRRAIESARPMADHLGVNLVIDSRLREVNFGAIEGLTPEEMQNRYPKLREDFLNKPADTKMPGGESGREALARAFPMIDEIIKSKDIGEVIIVCHGTLMRLISCKLLDIDVNEYRRTFPKISNVGKISLSIEFFEGDTAKNSKIVLI
jgi:broad specificity phosphatase PhoE